MSRGKGALGAWQRLLGALGFVAALLAGCTTVEPGERVYYLVGCGGGGTGLPNICWAKAEQLCPDGYTILSEDWGKFGGEPQSMRVACRKRSAKR